MDNRRKTIVINKPFQYQQSLLVVALAVLLINGFIILRMLFPGDDPIDMSTGQMTGLAILELVLVTGIWYGCLKASHRIAGPVYVFAREIGRLGEGDLRAKVILRDKDMFQPEAEKMNTSIAALRAKVTAIKELSEQLQVAQQAGTDLKPITEKIAIELAAFNIGNTH